VSVWAHTSKRDAAPVESIVSPPDMPLERARVAEIAAPTLEFQVSLAPRSDSYGGTARRIEARVAI
jgi:hypothetical protein